MTRITYFSFISFSVQESRALPSLQCLMTIYEEKRADIRENF